MAMPYEICNDLLNDKEGRPLRWPSHIYRTL